MSTQTMNYGTHTALTITNLNSLGNSATAGWQSAVVSNLVTLALDYEINIKLTMANTAPANDKTVYIYVAPAYYNGSSWFYNDGGTTTLPSGSEGTYTIASPNDLRLIGILSYTTQNMILQGTFFLSSISPNFISDGFSIIIVNYSGAAVSSSGNVVAYKAIKLDVA